MTDAYCPATLDGAPAHRCLCYHQPGHHGGHECRCGHYWLCTRDGSVVTWDDMTYDQQWQFLGLPDVGFKVTLDRFRRGLIVSAEHFKKVGEAVQGLTEALTRITESEAHHDRTA